MFFKKIIEPLNENLKRNGITEPNTLQSEILSKIKGGKSMFVIAHKNAGKTTSIVISVINKLKDEFEDAPRALIFVKDKEACLKLAEIFNTYKIGTDLRVYCAYEEHNMELQREELFLGTDIVIATPKRLNRIFYLNGINLNKLQMCIVEDAEFLFKNNNFAEVTRTPESIGRCQYLVFSDKYDNRFNRWQDSFMHLAEVVDFE